MWKNFVKKYFIFVIKCISSFPLHLWKTIFCGCQFRVHIRNSGSIFHTWSLVQDIILKIFRRLQIIIDQPFETLCRVVLLCDVVSGCQRVVQLTSLFWIGLHYDLWMKIIDLYTIFVPDEEIESKSVEFDHTDWMTMYYNW